FIYHSFSSTTSLLLFFSLLLCPPSSTLFPYTTLFRSSPQRRNHRILAYFKSFRPKTICPLHVCQSYIAESGIGASRRIDQSVRLDRKSTRLNSSHVSSSYAVFCLKKKQIDHDHC